MIRQTSRFSIAMILALIALDSRISAKALLLAAFHLRHFCFQPEYGNASRFSFYDSSG